MMQGHGPWPPLGTEAFQEGTLEEGESERHPLAPWLTSDPRILADQAWGKMLTVLAQMNCRWFKSSLWALPLERSFLL